MTFNERKKCKALIETIFQRQLDKPVIYHPALLLVLTTDKNVYLK
jgi:hypothetical protein